VSEAGAPVRVLFIEGGSRGSAADLVEGDAAVTVLRSLPDALNARNRITELQPDVVVLDLEMERMDAMLFLRILMQQSPRPVLAMSSLTPQGSWLALDALETGAVDVFVRSSSAHIAPEQRQDLVAKLKAAARTKFRQPQAKTSLRDEEPSKSGKTLILLGASTGGTEAIREILSQLPTNLPPICIVQHIPSDFSGLFAERLNSYCDLTVKEAANGDQLRPGCAFVAPGNKHMLLARDPSGKLSLKIRDGEKIMHHRPSIDLMFESVASVAASQTVAGLLTGMGRDGASGLLKLRQAGARTFAQDEKSSIVYGMPRAAADIGAAEKILPLSEVAAFIARSCAMRKPQEA
jgi:two-component system chemotaxis response regulator CheB